MSSVNSKQFRNDGSNEKKFCNRKTYKRRKTLKKLKRDINNIMNWTVLFLGGCLILFRMLKDGPKCKHRKIFKEHEIVNRSCSQTFPCFIFSLLLVRFLYCKRGKYLPMVSITYDFMATVCYGKRKNIYYPSNIFFYSNILQKQHLYYSPAT